MQKRVALFIASDNGLSSWCQSLARRIDAQIAKGTDRNLRRAERMIERYERDCL